MSQTITDAIAELYCICAMTPPTQQERVVVLNELLGGYNLTCIELVGLTSEAASHFLMRRGAIFEPIGNANQEPLAGYIYVDSHNGYIFVERDDLLVRRRFPVSHEFGHYVMQMIYLRGESSMHRIFIFLPITRWKKRLISLLPSCSCLLRLCSISSHVTRPIVAAMI